MRNGRRWQVLGTAIDVRPKGASPSRAARADGPRLRSPRSPRSGNWSAPSNTRVVRLHEDGRRGDADPAPAASSSCASRRRPVLAWRAALAVGDSARGPDRRVVTEPRRHALTLWLRGRSSFRVFAAAFRGQAVPHRRDVVSAGAQDAENRRPRASPRRSAAIAWAQVAHRRRPRYGGDDTGAAAPAACSKNVTPRRRRSSPGQLNKILACARCSRASPDLHPVAPALQDRRAGADPSSRSTVPSKRRGSGSHRGCISCRSGARATPPTAIRRPRERRGPRRRRAARPRTTSSACSTTRAATRRARKRNQLLAEELLDHTRRTAA